MPVAWMTLVIVLWVVVVGLIALVLGLSRRLRELAGTAAARGASESGTVLAPGRMAATGPAIGSPFPLSLPDPPLGAGIAADEATHQIVLFLNSSCEPCRSLGEALRGSSEIEDGLAGIRRRLVTDPRGEGVFVGLPVTDVIIQHDNEIARRLEIDASPFGIAVDSSGIVRWSGIPHDVGDVLAMAAACGGPRVEPAYVAAPTRPSEQMPAV